MIPSLIQLMDFRIQSNDLTDSYNEKVLLKRKLLVDTYRRLAFCLTKFDLHLVYACRGDEVTQSNILAKADQAVRIYQDAFSECTATFEFCGNTKLIDIYRKSAKKKLELQYEQCINQNGQFVLLSTLDNYCKFITDSDGKLNKHLFDANVRDYLGLNPVNSDIMQSLRHTTGPDF